MKACCSLLSIVCLILIAHGAVAQGPGLPGSTRPPPADLKPPASARPDAEQPGMLTQDAVGAPTQASGGTAPAAAMTCTCAEPVRSGAAMALAGVLLVVLVLSASAAFAAAALYLFKKSRTIRAS